MPAWFAARSVARVTPGCTGPTSCDLEYFVVPPRRFEMRKCGGCGSEFLDPRPLESELPPFYPSDYHAYNENHDGVARLLVQFRARSRARSYGRLIQNRPGRIFDVGTGDCRHFDELRQRLDLECAGVEIQPDIAAKGQARGYDVLEGTLETVDLTGHVGRYDIVSMNHVLEHVVYPHTMLEHAPRSVASRWTCHRPIAHRLVVGEQVVRAQLGGLPLPATPADPIQGRAIRSPQDVGFSSVKIRSAPHIQTTISLQNSLVRWGWRPHMQNGKTPVYGLLLITALPFETVAWLCDEGGIIDFQAQKPPLVTIQ